VQLAVHEYESQYRKRRPKKPERDCDAPLAYLLTWLEAAVRGLEDHGSESSELEQAIDASTELLSLPESWDEEGALQISESTWKTAIDFLRRTHASVQSRLGKDLLIPTIGPCTDGSIDLFWKAPKFSLLVNIKPVGTGESDYYGETDDGLKASGTFHPNSQDLGFLDWLVNR
jgi:hypothetical protein